MKNHKDCFYYFLEKYKEQTGLRYNYSSSKLGLELMKVKRLGLTYKGFIDFINWLFFKHKLSSINFLLGQLNDYHASREYEEKRSLEKTIMHHKIMSAKKKIVDTCKICGGYGRLKDFSRCKCLIRLMVERDKIIKEQ